MHVNFQPYLQRVSQLATNCNAKVYVTSSFRRPGAPISGAVVPPASSSNHFVGYAIDFNLTPSSSNAIGCNSACLGGAVSAMPAYAQCFTQGISGLGLRWGKSFNPTDPVHIDYPLNLNNPSQYISITNSVVNC